MAIEDYYNTLTAVDKFTEGTAPDFEQSYILQNEFYGLLDRASSSRVWTDTGSIIKINSKFFCDADTDIKAKDRLRVIESHIIATADVGSYHKALEGSWELTATESIGLSVIFYQASTIAGLDRKADGDIYNILPVHNPNEMDRHLELLLEKVGE